MLGYREIVTVVPLSEQTDAALQVTEWLTRRFEAHVHFIHSQKEIGAGIGIPTETEADIRRLQILMEEGRRRQEAERTEVRATVENWKAKVGTDAELTLHTAPPGRALSTYLMTADIAVLPPPGSIQDLDTEAVLLESGRPVILALEHPAETLGERIAIFWRCTPPTSHAVAAAMPCLREASRVELISVEADEQDESAERAATWLRRHQVDVQVERVKPVDGSTVGDTLLKAAADFGADLLVMGAYGHSRLHEWALGSVTKHVFRSAQRPVFACH